MANAIKELTKVETPTAIEEPTLIALTQDTDITDLATKAYNGEVLVQWYVDKMMDDTMPLPPPLLMPCSPLVIPMDANNPFIIGFATNCIYVFGNRPESSLANDMKPAALVCVLRSTPNIQITKDGATVCGVLADMSASSFTYLSIEDFSEQYFVPKFLITPLYSKQQQVHPAVLVAPMFFDEHDVRFYDGASGEELKVLAVEDGMQIPEEEIPEGYDFWTDLPDIGPSPQHYTHDDIVSIQVPGELNFYGWYGFTVYYFNGETGELISTEQVDGGSMPSNLPYPDWYWFDVSNPDSSITNIDPTNVPISGDTSYWGWGTDPRPELEPLE